MRVDGFSKISAIDRPASAAANSDGIGLQLRGQIQHVQQLGGTQIVDGEVVTCHGAGV